MNTLPINAEDSALLTLLEEWTELLASAVYGYGCPGYTREEAARVFGRADYKVTSLRLAVRLDDLIVTCICSLRQYQK